MPASPPTALEDYHPPPCQQCPGPYATTSSVPTPVSASTAGGPAMSFALRKQLQTKAQSLLRGLEHVRRCTAGDACGSSLCHSTRRLLRTVQTHQCPAAAGQCRVCALWQFLMAAESSAKVATASPSIAPSTPPHRVCGRSAMLSRPPSLGVRRRVLAATKEAAASRRLA